MAQCARANFDYTRNADTRTAAYGEGPWGPDGDYTKLVGRWTAYGGGKPELAYQGMRLSERGPARKSTLSPRRTSRKTIRRYPPLRQVLGFFSVYHEPILDQAKLLFTRKVIAEDPADDLEYFRSRVDLSSMNKALATEQVPLAEAPDPLPPEEPLAVQEVDGRVEITRDA